MALPAADGKVFQEIIFTELQRDEAQALIEQYNKVPIFFLTWGIDRIIKKFKIGYHFFGMYDNGPFLSLFVQFKVCKKC